MYLYDRIAQSGSETLIEDHAGRVHSVPGAADLAADLRACAARYVLDDSVRDCCLELLCERPEVIRLEDECYRIPHQAMWLEWIDSDAAGAARAGVLVLADESGRRGTMHSFSQDCDGRPWVTQILFEFDFDNEISTEASLCGIRFDSVKSPEEVHRIYRHSLGRIDNRWLAYFRASGGIPPGGLQTMMRAAVPDFGMLCAFLLLLSLECASTEPRQGLDKINRARARAGRALLLDHVEVSLRLALVGGTDSERGHHSRAASRLHQVRGHLVRRAGKTFWRTHHLRGDVGRGVIASRTVRVTGSAAAMRSALG